MFGRLGGTEMLIILIVGFLIWGPKKLPEIGKSFGDTIREFKKSSKVEAQEDTVIDKSEIEVK